MNDLVNPQDKLPATTPAELLSIAVSQGADLEKLEKLMELQERWEKNEARKAYVSAMNSFKADPPSLFKNMEVSYGNTSYKHASLDHVSNEVGAFLAKHGLSHHWNTEQLEGGTIRVTCVIIHDLGHSESVSLQAGADQSGSKNNIQAIGSTVTYLQRYTLLSATGLAVKGQDDDGAGADPVETITEQEAADLECMIDETGSDKAKFLEYLKIKDLKELRASSYKTTVQLLEMKRAKEAAKKAAKKAKAEKAKADA